ncbi:hypothetical protein HanOQP8_Chr16g0604491 [Helianthus annuus]|nr:hypothetical protein HanLR1_Chr16g0608401 [Helianthus annuus]KAJ0643794.1 hypothetical protein HanOQP8_Chr16g0604491 [Helianthus annuus]
MEVKNEKLKREHVQILEQNSGLSVQNQKLSEEASYAKELASDAAVELKNLAGEVTKLSLQNAKLEKDLATARETNRPKPERNGRISGRVNDEFDLDLEDLRRELHTTKQREANLEAALAEKEVIENEYVKKAEESKKKEAILENDLANMWVLVAELKKEVNGSNVNNGHVERNDVVNELRLDDNGDLDDSVKERWVVDVQKVVHDVPKEEPLVARLKVRFGH